MRYWWVNQNKTFAHEFAGGYLWSPKRNANDHRNHFYDTMRVVAPGDLVLSFKGTYIQAVGVARNYCYESPKPDEFGNAGEYWNHIGWRVDVNWTRLRTRIRPAEHMEALKPTLPLKYSPIQATGRGLQGVYLAEVPKLMMEVMAGLIGYELRLLMDASPLPIPDRVADRPAEAEKVKSDWENHLVEEIRNDPGILDTDRVALVRSRRGQGIYRRNVRLVEKACRVTGVDNPEHLIASHCKPWRHSKNDERLDGENGLMLTPSIDHLFDRGFISFEDKGDLIVSPVADVGALKRMGIDTDHVVNVGGFSSGQKTYLDYHRNRILLAAG